MFLTCNIKVAQHYHFDDKTIMISQLPKREQAYRPLHGCNGKMGNQDDGGKIKSLFRNTKSTNPCLLNIFVTFPLKNVT